MSAFISHSFENKPAFESVTDALDIRGMAFWNPAEISSGPPCANNFGLQ
jgi:hypothetical protein